MPPDMPTIARMVAKSAGVTVDDLRGHKRYPELVRPRWQAMSLMHEQGHSKSAIARYFGKHHTAVAYGIDKHNERAAITNMPERAKGSTQ